MSDITNYVSPVRNYNGGTLNSSLRLWVATTTVSSGGWTVDYSAAGFTQVFGVFAQAQAVGTSNGDANYASVRTNTITTTGCSGRSSNAVTVGLLLATVNQPSANGTIITVLVIGI